MSEIIALVPRHYIGTAAEIAGITGVCGDTAYSSDTDVYYHWNGASWGAGGLSFYEPLDCATFYKSLGDFTRDGAFHPDGLDLSPILPVGTIAAKIRLDYCSNGVSHIAHIRQNATINNMESLLIKTPVANVDISRSKLINVDSDRLLDYFFHANTTQADLYVSGYMIRRCL